VVPRDLDLAQGDCAQETTRRELRDKAGGEVLSSDAARSTISAFGVGEAS